MIPAGRLTARITFIRQTAGTGSRGQQTGTWEPVRTVSAEATELAGRELEAARQRYATATMLFRLRHPREWMPLATDRITYRDRTWAIGAIYDPDQRRRDLIVACSSVE